MSSDHLQHQSQPFLFTVGQTRRQWPRSSVTLQILIVWQTSGNTSTGKQHLCNQSDMNVCLYSKCRSCKMSFSEAGHWSWVTDTKLPCSNKLGLKLSLLLLKPTIESLLLPLHSETYKFYNTYIAIFFTHIFLNNKLIWRHYYSGNMKKKKICVIVVPHAHVRVFLWFKVKTKVAAMTVADFSSTVNQLLSVFLLDWTSCFIQDELKCASVSLNLFYID